MNDIFFDFSKYPGEHIIKMYTNISSNASRLTLISFPTNKIPFASTGKVS